jgi:nitrate reductase NapE component
MGQLLQLLLGFLKSQAESELQESYAWDRTDLLGLTLVACIVTPILIVAVVTVLGWLGWYH